MSDAPTRPRLLTPREVQQRLGLVSDQRLAQWRHRDKGPVYVKIAGTPGQIGGLVRYPEDELEKWIAARTVVPRGAETPPTDADTTGASATVPAA